MSNQTANTPFSGDRTSAVAVGDAAITGRIISHQPTDILLSIDRTGAVTVGDAAVVNGRTVDPQKACIFSLNQ